MTIHRALSARIRTLTNESAALFRAASVLYIQGEDAKARVLDTQSAEIDAELDELFGQLAALEAQQVAA